MKMMRCESYFPFLYFKKNLDLFLSENLIAQFPVFTIDRVAAYNDFPTLWNTIANNATDRTSYPAFAKIELEANYKNVPAADGKPVSVNLEAVTTFWFDEQNQNYKLAFVLTENHVGPYAQVNMYDRSQIGYVYQPAGDFATAGVKPEIYHDYVARDIFGVYGIDNTIDATVIEAKKEYSTGYTVSLANVRDLENCNIIAMIIDGKSGEIANAVSIPAPKYDSAGISQIDVDDNAPSEYYNLQGIRVNAPVPGELYILRQGAKVSKIIAH